MSTTQTEPIELSSELTGRVPDPDELVHVVYNDDQNAPASAVDAVPDGGYGWVVVLACAVVTFLFNGWSGAWGIMQTALLQQNVMHTSTSTLSFVGSLGLALCVLSGLGVNKLSERIGARAGMFLGAFLMGISSLLASFTLNNIGGLFMTAGVCFGLGNSFLYTLANTLPVQWFSRRLGTANGFVKLGGGIGATVWALASQALINKVGIAWTFRIFGLFTLATGTVAAAAIKERGRSTPRPFIDWSLFKNLPFCCVLLTGAIGTFAIFVPPFFLPLFAQSIGLSASTGAGIVAAFNACTAVGRFGAGYACDKVGSTNMLLITMVINAVSMLSIWPISNSTGPLIVFAALNGFSNGAFFVTLPTAVASIVGSDKAAVGMGMAVTGWTGGYLMGSPIAGMLIAATGAENAHSVVPYRAAIFYAGGVACASAACVLVARLSLNKKILKKL